MIEISMKDALELYTVLTRQFDTYNKDGKDIPFTLGAVRFDIARNANVLKPSIEAYEKARNDLITQLSNGTGKLDNETNPAVLMEFGTEVEKILGQRLGFDVTRIEKEDLKLDVNPIAITALMVLHSTGVLRG